ncbi:MAG: cyclic nucleotide-binding protein [Chthoniobacterales bacterium]|nr:MAG: cyclic nucleotide-binding protein [Chthoniobacterales bacterium]
MSGQRDSSGPAVAGPDQPPSAARSQAAAETQENSGGATGTGDVIDNPCLERSIPVRNVPLFAGLDDAAIEKLCHFLQLQEFPPRQLFRAGDTGDAMYVIVSGRVRITVTDADDGEVILAALGPGDFFGEMAMLDGHGRSADAAVVEHAQLAVLTRQNFLEFVRSDATIAVRMLSTVTQRLRRTDDLLRHRISRNANEEDARNLTFADLAADKIARFGGSWKFIIFSFVLLLVWMAVNSMLLRERPFDPFPFVLLNLVLGMMAALQAPIIMMSQNREAQKDRLRADLDYQVNLKNEMLLGEILRILKKREHDELLRLGEDE